MTSISFLILAGQWQEGIPDYSGMMARKHF